MPLLITSGWLFGIGKSGRIYTFFENVLYKISNVFKNDIKHICPKLDLNKLINCGIEYSANLLKTILWVDVLKS